MPTYLLTWNPDRFEWSSLNAEAAALASGQRLTSRWSCGNTTSIPSGARFFLYKQGAHGRGIVGSGWTTRATYQDTHWDPARAVLGHSANYVDIVLESILSPDFVPLPVADLVSGPLAGVHWSSPASGIRIEEHAAAELERLWESLDTGASGTRLSDSEELRSLEGVPRQRLIRHLSRDRTLRNSKLAAALQTSPDGALRCEVPGCGFDFRAVYGELGAGFAHVHHLLPLSKLDEPHEVTLDSLAIVCANCHAMIHRGGECRALAGLIVPAT